MTVIRDGFGVAHVNGRTRAAVFYAAGWIAAEDRGLLMELLRSAGRLSAIDAPGFNAFAVALTGRRFEPSAQTESFIAKQFDLVRGQGAEGRQALADIEAFLVGLNAYNKKAGLPIAPWTRNDVLAVSTVIAARFGAGGGDEARRAEFLSALRQKLGGGAGRPGLHRPQRARRPGFAGVRSQPFPVRLGPCARRRRVGRPRRQQPAGARSRRPARLDEQRNPGRREPVGLRSPDLRRGAAARLLLP